MNINADLESCCEKARVSRGQGDLKKFRLWLKLYWWLFVYSSAQSIFLSQHLATVTQQMVTPWWGQSPADLGQHRPEQWPATRPGWRGLICLCRRNKDSHLNPKIKILPGAGVRPSESFWQEEAVWWCEGLDQILRLTLLERSPQQVRVRLSEGSLQQLGVSVGQGGAQELWVSLGHGDTEQLGTEEMRVERN